MYSMCVCIYIIFYICKYVTNLKQTICLIKEEHTSALGQRVHSLILLSFALFQSSIFLMIIWRWKGSRLKGMNVLEHSGANYHEWTTNLDESTCVFPFLKTAAPPHHHFRTWGHPQVIQMFDNISEIIEIHARRMPITQKIYHIELNDRNNMKQLHYTSIFGENKTSLKNIVFGRSMFSSWSVSTNPLKGHWLRNPKFAPQSRGKGASRGTKLIMIFGSMYDRYNAHVLQCQCTIYIYIYIYTYICHGSIY